MLSRLVQPEIKSLIEERRLSELKNILSDWTPSDISELLIDLPENDQAIVFRLLSKDLAADVFEYLDFDIQMVLIKAMGRGEVASVLNEMSPDDRTALLEELPSSAAKQLIAYLTPDERKIAQTLLGYPEDSVGRLMTPDYIAVRPEWSMSEALSFIRENGKDSETLNIIYVVDAHGKLIDDIRIRDVILASLDKNVIDLMDENFVALNVHDDQETAVQTFKKYDRVALPVVDSYGMLLGIVTVDDVLDVAEEEATEDFQKIGGMEALGEPYISVSFLEMVKKRAGWLVILFVSEMLTSTAMGFFENEISKAVVLSLFVPLIISAGGNSGSQSSTLVVRAMAIGEVKIRDWWRVMKREIMLGLSLGCILGIVGFLRISLWSAFSNVYGPHWVLIALTILCSLIGVILWGTLLGSMMPFALKKFGVDPATSSSPFVATMVDVAGIIIYFTTALFILSGTVLK